MSKNLFSHFKKETKKKRPQDSFVHRVMNDPYLDWFYIFIFSIILAIVYIINGFFTYSRVQNSLSAPSKEVVGNISGIFSSEALSDTLKNFENRSIERTRVRNGYNGVFDPSL